jgi:hypothetical protein
MFWLFYKWRIIITHDSMSDMAVDLFKYINHELPLDRFNIENGLRNNRDYQYLKSLPGRKFQLSKEDTAILMEVTKRDMVWLKDNFGISYALNCKSHGNTPLVFEDDYVKDMTVVLKKSNPIIRKLIHGYITQRLAGGDLDTKSRDNLRTLESHFNDKFAFTTNLSYTKLAYRQRVIWILYDLLRRSKTLRWLKHQWMDKQGSIS